MNASDKDMDLWDIDYTQTVTDDDGNVEQELLRQAGWKLYKRGICIVYELKAEKND